MQLKTLSIKTNTLIGVNMTIKKDLYVYRVMHGSKRIKKIKLKKLLSALNMEVFTKKFFATEKEAKEHIKDVRDNNNSRTIGNQLLFNK